jgi:Flp pilus assembly protein TadG
MKRLLGSVAGRPHQCGATAIEFAFVFPVLFLLVYGVIVYSYVYVLQQSITFAAQHSVDAAVAVSPVPDGDYQARLETRVRAVAVQSLNWLPASQQASVTGVNGNLVQISYESLDGGQALRVGLAFNTQGLFPTLVLPLVGAVPPLPAQLRAQAVTRI